MKTFWLLVATIFLMNFTACKSSSNDLLNNETVNVSKIVAEFGAKIVATGDTGTVQFKVDELSPITVEKAMAILHDIRNHKNAQKSFAKSKTTKGDGVFSVLMSEKVADHLKLSVQLNMVELKDGTLCYKNYQTDCASSICTWYVTGFSFSNDNQSAGNYKFQSSSYLNFMVIDNGVKYLQIPLTIRGVFDPLTQNADFTYNL